MAPTSPAAALSVLLAVGLLSAQELPDTSPRISSYDIVVELIPEDHLVRGTQTVTWRNTTQASTQELRFHLYLNAFRDQDSTLMRESDEAFRDVTQAGVDRALPERRVCAELAAIQSVLAQQALQRPAVLLRGARRA